MTAYKLVTANAGRAGTAAEAPAVVDAAMSAAITMKRPAYIEINMGIWNLACPIPTRPLPVTNPPVGTEQQLAMTIVGLIRAAQSPVILLGTEIQRYGLADKVADLIAKLGIQWASALLSKSTLPEEGPGWIGVYDPPHSQATVQDAVAQADLLVTLGCMFPNGYAALVESAFGRMVQIYDSKVRIKTGAKQPAEIGALVSALVTEAAKAPPRPATPGVSPVTPGPATGSLTYKQVFERIGVALDDSWIIIPDTFLGIYSAANLPVKGRDAFLCSGVWASLGHSVGAAVGASFGSTRRPLVICGDGGFHMMAQALSTMLRYALNPVIILIANSIFGYEQFLVDPTFFTNSMQPPRPYVVLREWDFVKFADGIGLQFAQEVDTAAALDAALAAVKTFNGPAMIIARVDPRDLPAELS